jgi:hypothetical protein
MQIFYLGLGIETLSYVKKSLLFSLDDRSLFIDSLGVMDPAALFQHYSGGPCPGNGRPLSLGEAPDIPGGDANGSGGPGMEIFFSEPGHLYYLCAGPDPEGQMGRRQTHKDSPRVQRLCGSEQVDIAHGFKPLYLFSQPEGCKVIPYYF